MSWDVLLLRLPLSTKALSDLPISYVPPPFGTRAAVVTDLSRVAPGVEWLTSVFGTLRAEDYVVEVDLGKAEKIDRVLLHVRGSDAALRVVHAMATALGARAVDCETDAVVDFDDATASSGLESWRQRKSAEVATDTESRRLMEEAPDSAVFPMAGPRSPRN